MRLNPRNLFTFALIVLSFAIQAQGVVNVPSKRSLKDLQALPDDTTKVLILNRVGWDTAYYNLALGIEYAQEGLRVAEKINYPRGIITSYNTLGATYSDMGNYDEALSAHMNGLKYAEQLGDNNRIATACMNISNIYTSTEDSANAMKYINRAIENYRLSGNMNGLAVAYVNLAGLYSYLEMHREAIAAFHKSLELRDKVRKHVNVAYACSGMAVAMAETGQFDSAHIYIERALAIVDTMDQPYEKAKMQANAARVYGIEKNYPKAELFYLQAMKIFREVGVREELVEFYKDLSEIYQVSGRNKEALSYWREFMSLKDSLVNEEVLDHQQNLEAMYESEKKKQEIELLTRKGNVRQWFLLAIVACAVVLVFLTIMLYKRNQFRKKTNAETAKQNAQIELITRNITDSISYASRIQEAVIPSEIQLKNRFADAFVLSKPKDIVSGDFWWGASRNDEFLLAVADSTGHGVPGGFMSMLGSVFLFEIVTEKGVSSPEIILSQLRTKVISALNRSGLGSGMKDGMDMVMCSFSKDNRRINFSCAMNPLWVIRKNAVIEYRPDKFPVGEYHGEVKDFTLLEHETQPGDMIYLFSDGYADQFGGPNGKKLKYKLLRDILCEVSSLPCDEQRTRIEEKFSEWKGKHEQVDDVLVIGIRI